MWAFHLLFCVLLLVALYARAGFYLVGTLAVHERFYFEGPQNHLWCAVFSAVWDGPLQVQPEEVQQACFMPVDEALRHEAKPLCRSLPVTSGRALQSALL